jgi:hypothetical protein
MHDERQFICDQLAGQPTHMDVLRLVLGGADRRAHRAFPGFVTPISLVTRRAARDCFAALAMTAPV